MSPGTETGNRKNVYLLFFCNEHDPKKRVTLFFCFVSADMSIYKVDLIYTIAYISTVCIALQGHLVPSRWFIDQSELINVA